MSMYLAPMTLCAGRTARLCDTHRVQAEDFVRIIRDFGVDVQEEVTQRLLEYWNMTPEGRVNYQEFVDLLS